ncbi:MAG: hypothetical protein ACD_29C00485G0004 [uncultured bacterium]|nr:MAG: hypothetical protein ACD_29C00485G0004 [uncultured bacterium]
MYIVDDLFFLIEAGSVLVWNYKNHQQYILETDYFLELLQLSKTNNPQNESICKELLEANLITDTPNQSNKWGWDVLSRIFHFGTQNAGSATLDVDPIGYTKNYLDQCNKIQNTIPSLFAEREGPLLELPEPEISLLDTMSFLSVLKKRKTSRAFNSEKISLKEFSLILYCSFGLIHGGWEELARLGLMQTGIRKASPSSGGLHSEEAYVVVYRVDGLEQGLYHYRPQDHKLTQLREGDFEKQTIRMNYNQFFSEGLSFGVYLAVRLEKIWWKYKHSRSYRGALLDMGHVSQNFLVVSTALELQTWMTAAFHDSQVESFLGIDGCKESVILFVGVGKGTNQAIPEVMREQLKKRNK